MINNAFLLKDRSVAFVLARDFDASMSTQYGTIPLFGVGPILIFKVGPTGNLLWSTSLNTIEGRAFPPDIEANLVNEAIRVLYTFQKNSMLKSYDIDLATGTQKTNTLPFDISASVNFFSGNTIWNNDNTTTLFLLEDNYGTIFRVK